MNAHDISVLIDESPMNKGVNGAAWLLDPHNAAMVEGGTVVLFEHQHDTIVGFHWLKTSGNARATIRETREAMRKFFEAHPRAKVICGEIPEDRRDSKIMARWIGAEPGWVIRTPFGRCQIFSITREKLAGRN